MGFTVRCSTSIRIKDADKLFTSEESFATYEEGYAFYKNTATRLAERVTHEMRVDFFNPYGVSLMSSYIHPKKKGELLSRAARLKKAPRAVQSLKSKEIKTLLLLFSVLKRLLEKQEFTGNTAEAIKRIFHFIDALSPKLNAAIDNKDPVIQITYLD